ncbi:MAG TPA: zinc ribbon domain-containing protein [Streptosporangiaceae bacterium]|nr:zinc ribbon domain-containing protein [Streptosporangiaceae bacterium]
MAPIEDQLPAGRVTEAVRAQQVGPFPRADRLTLPYWEAGICGELRIQRCHACGYRNHPPKPRCRRCGSGELTWDPLAAPFVLYSFAVADAPLWVPAVIGHPDQADLRIFSEVTDCDVRELRIGARLDVAFRPVRGAQGTPLYLPVFRLRGAS